MIIKTICSFSCLWIYAQMVTDEQLRALEYMSRVLSFWDSDSVVVKLVPCTNSRKCNKEQEQRLA